MAKFFKNLFSSSSSSTIPITPVEDKKVVKEKKDAEENREFSTPYDTKRKLSISRSGRMKQNLKARGRLGGDLYGEITQKVEKTSIEYRVNKKDFFEDDTLPPPPTLQTDAKEQRLEVQKVSKSAENINEANSVPHKNDSVSAVENNFKYLESLDDENYENDANPARLEVFSKFTETNF